MILLELFLGFLRIGFFAFGGAYGAIPLIRETVLSHGWVSEQTLVNMIAVSESTPGPIMVNLATYVGSSQAGLPGAFVATCAVVLPSFGILLLILTILRSALKNRYVRAALRGMKPCIIGIILATGSVLTVRSCLLPAPDWKSAVLTAVLILIFYGGSRLLRKKRSPYMLIALSAVLGILFF